MAGFSGGDRLKNALRQLEVALGDPNRVVRVGFLEGSTCGKNNDASAPEVAWILENGTIGRQILSSFNSTRPHGAWHIPPRPFFRGMITRRQATWGKALAQLLKINHYDTKKALMGIGLVMGEQLQLEITQFTDPGNAPSTIAAKGFDKPLEDSKNMKRAISYEVDAERLKVNESA